jgi:LmbE family N-acetylglucosaminyl deacetylase
MAWIEEILGRPLVLVAHPDDECVAFGALLQRIREPLVVYATNGAPRDPYFWRKYGSPEAYAAMRQREAMQSMQFAGVKDVLFLSEMPDGERFVDQELFRNLMPAFEQLADLVRRRMITGILTLAYEGGHPDHDSCSFLAAQLSKLASIPCWEAPLYRRVDEGGGVFQDFREQSGEEMDVRPTVEELERKRAMCHAYPSQGEFLAHFNIERELVRPQFAYDYSRPPHSGKVNYEVWQWSMTAEEVCAAFSDFLRTVAAETARRR